MQHLPPPPPHTYPLTPPPQESSIGVFMNPHTSTLGVAMFKSLEMGQWLFFCPVFRPDGKFLKKSVRK